MTDAGKYLPGANFSKRAVSKSFFPIQNLHESVALASTATTPMRSGFIPYAGSSPTPATKSAQKQIQSHPDYPIKCPSHPPLASTTGDIPTNIGRYRSIMVPRPVLIFSLSLSCFCAAAMFEADQHGDLLWFPSPPLDVPIGDVPIHSLDYLSFKQKQCDL